MAPSDTAPAAERVVIEGYRAMSPARKLQCVVAMNRALRQVAAAGIRLRHGVSITESELQLRLAALWLDAETMAAAFGWDPGIRGL